MNFLPVVAGVLASLLAWWINRNITLRGNFLTSPMQGWKAAIFFRFVSVFLFAGLLFAVIRLKGQVEPVRMMLVFLFFLVTGMIVDLFVSLKRIQKSDSNENTAYQKIYKSLKN